MKFAEELAQHRRLSILRTLAESDGRANDSVLKSALEMVGLSAGLTRQVVREDLEFLQKMGCVKLDWYSETLVVATIKERGVDVAEGRIRIDGVHKPSVGA